VPPAQQAALPRILLALSGATQLGGAEIMLLRVLGAAQAENWSVTCIAPPGALADQLRQAGVRTIAGPPLGRGSRPAVLAAILFGIRCLQAALRLASLAEADVILVNGLLPLVPVRLLSPHCAVVYYAQDVVVRPPKTRLLRGVGPVIDLVVAVSESVAQPLRDLGLDCRVVRNGVSVAATSTLRAAARPYVIGCNGALTPWKGQDVLLDAVAHLPDRTVLLELLGPTYAGRDDQRFAARLRARANEPDLQRRVRFLGHRSSPLAIMRGWRVAVSASVDPEASGLAVLEAMSLGLPQVCTNNGGPAEVLGEAGIIVPTRNPGALAGAIQTLLDDADKWRRASLAGPVRVRAMCSVAAQCAGFTAAIEEVANRGATTGFVERWRHRRFGRPS
jgi:glycosyltransferase involved in cell wall biosynthesis